MATSPARDIILHLRGSVLAREGTSQTSGQLLEAFLSQQDEAAVATLIQRHGPMVWGVCRRVLRNYHDAQDAFQTTFLVLVRKAASVVPREMIAGWLYGVAYQTALKAKSMAGKRRARERQVEPPPEPAVTEPLRTHYFEDVLDQELIRLPYKYRVVLILCDLEGKTRKETARQLGCPEGTVAGRLARAKAMLAKRLARHDAILPAGAFAAVLSRDVASAGVSTSLVTATIETSTLFAAGAGILPTQVAALTQGVMKAMFLTKLKLTAVVVAAVGVLLGTGAGLLSRQVQADMPPEKIVKQEAISRLEVKGVVKSVDEVRDTVTLHPDKGLTEETTFTLAKDAKVFLDDGTGEKLGFQEGRAADLIEGASVILRLSADRHEVVRAWVEGPVVQGILKTVDAANNSITVTVALSKTEPEEDRSFAVAKSAKLFIDDGRPVDKSKPAIAPVLADIPPNALVTLKLSADRKVVGGISAEGQSVAGVLKAVHAIKNTVTITVSVVKGEPGVDKVFAVENNATVFIDDGKAKDKSKSDSFGELPVGAIVTLRLTLDQQSVVAIRAEGNNVHGTVRAVDVVKDTITLSEKPEGERTYEVMKNAVVVLDGRTEPKKLADVPIDAVVEVRMLADQRTVRHIAARGPTIVGHVSAKPGNDSISVGNKEGDQSFAMAKDVQVVIDELRVGKSSELIEGTSVQLRLSADKSTVLDIRAEGPSFQGTVKAIDAEKNTITLTIGAKNGEGGVDKEFKLTKGTLVLTEINGVALKLADLKIDKEVVLRLSIDQRAANRIRILGE